MRSATFLSAAVLAAAFFSSSFPVTTSRGVQIPAQRAQPRSNIRGSDGEPMVTRAYIDVVPMDLMAERNRQLQSLRSRVSQLEVEDMRLASAKPEIREQLARQVQVMNALLQYIGREQVDEGKSPAAMEVKQHLNEIEGKGNCQACHTSVMADSPRAQAHSGR
jgi:hypothetical protein